MKVSLVVCLLLASALAVTAIPSPKSFCGVSGTTLGGWTVVEGVNSTDVVSGSYTYEELMGMAVEEWEATSGNTLPCTDPLFTPEIVCSQVVAGVNYKIYFTAECEDAAPVDFEAAIFVPLYSNPAGTEPQITSVKKVKGTSRRLLF
ncbi:hypothetical protein N2152v2_009387 [Parachlorella kessleri]